MKFQVKMWGDDSLCFDIRLHDGHGGDTEDNINVYLCAVNGNRFYFESKADDELWTILDNAILALKEFRKKGAH